jgi:hypothetical protein
MPKSIKAKPQKRKPKPKVTKPMPIRRRRPDHKDD